MMLWHRNKFCRNMVQENGLLCSLKKQHCINNNWQLKETMITLKHKDNLSIPSPPALNETWEGKKGVEVKTWIRIYNSYPCSLSFCIFVLFLSRNWSDYKSERIEVAIWGIVLKLPLWTQSVIWTPNVLKLRFVKEEHLPTNLLWIYLKMYWQIQHSDLCIHLFI